METYKKPVITNRGKEAQIVTISTIKIYTLPRCPVHEESLTPRKKAID